MFIPSRIISPLSTEYTPEIKFNRVDFPAPLPPIIVTKSPGCKCKSIPWIACFSVIVPGLNVFVIFESLSIVASNGISHGSLLFW